MHEHVKEEHNVYPRRADRPLESLHNEYLAATEWVNYNALRDQKRRTTQKQMLEFLHTYLSGGIGNVDFASTYDLKTRTDWDQFGFKGFSGGMVLNMTVKHIAEQEQLSFREGFISLAAALALPSWELEHLCAWYAKVKLASHKSLATGAVPLTSPPPMPIAPDNVPKPVAPSIVHDEDSEHSRIQHLLATIGKRLGCKIWIASNDRSRTWNGQRLGDLSLAELPNLGMGDASQRTVSLIDVLWLTGTNQLRAALEVEHSTSIYSGLLRMADLAAVSPNLAFPLYIVAPEDRLPQVRKQLERPSMRELELHKRCGFFSSESLIAQSEPILKWANDPNVIDQLAQRIPADAVD